MRRSIYLNWMTELQALLEPSFLVGALSGLCWAVQDFCAFWNWWWHLWSLSEPHLTASCLPCVNLGTPYAKHSLFPVQLSRECRAEVQRILHQRAMDVKLDPALQDKCMIDLGKWCSEKTETGQVLYTICYFVCKGWERYKGDKRMSCCFLIVENVLKISAIWNTICTRLRQVVQKSFACSDVSGMRREKGIVCTKGFKEATLPPSTLLFIIIYYKLDISHINFIPFPFGKCWHASCVCTELN